MLLKAEVQGKGPRRRVAACGGKLHGIQMIFWEKDPLEFQEIYNYS